MMDGSLMKNGGFNFSKICWKLWRSVTNDIWFRKWIHVRVHVGFNQFRFGSLHLHSFSAEPCRFRSIFLEFYIVTLHGAT